MRWNQLGNFVLNDMKEGNFDEICKKVNQDYYETKEKYERLEAQKR